MQAIETTGTIDIDGQLQLDQPLHGMQPGRVNVFVSSAEPAATAERSIEEPAFDPDVAPIWELAAEISAQVPDEEWKKLPTDLAKNFDQYQKQRRSQ
jgi:hypothetical protein